MEGWAVLMALACLVTEGCTEKEEELEREGGGRGEGGAKDHEEGKGGNVSSSAPPPSLQVPDINAVYTVLERFPGQSIIGCTTEENSEDFYAEKFPKNIYNPYFRDTFRGEVQQVEWRPHLTWQTGATAWGVVCADRTAPHYPVSFPLMSSKAQLVPEYISYTINAGDQLSVSLRGATPYGRVSWQKEPRVPSGWRQANLTSQGALVIPAALLSGSGFYSVANNGNVSAPRTFGTLSLTIRDCPAQRYGVNCSEWCPDCMHGGVCHPLTGVCVCPETLMGRNCQTPCKKFKSGRNCTRNVIFLPGDILCRPSPVPCRCTPGYTGARCGNGCPGSRWGIDCTQECRHRCLGDCDSQSAECDDLGPAPCAGGDVGLPRLRKAPEVMEIESEAATVVFSEWTEDYDDGDASSWDTRAYVVRWWPSNSKRMQNEEQVLPLATQHKLTRLQPATDYFAQVLVAVSHTAKNLTCVASGTGRERVHTVNFTTKCPQDMPAPSIIDVLKATDKSIILRWKPVPRPSRCSLEYHLRVIPASSRRHKNTTAASDDNGTSTEPGESSDNETLTLRVTETRAEVGGLDPAVAYTVTLLARSTVDNVSSPVTFTEFQFYPTKSGSLMTVMAVVVVVLLLSVAAMVTIGLKIKRATKKKPHVTPSQDGNVEVERL